MREGRVQVMPSVGIKMETAADSAPPKEMLNIHIFKVIWGYFVTVYSVTYLNFHFSVL